jgi:hypothetical protein
MCGAECGMVVSRQELRLRKWLKILKLKDTQHRNSFRRDDFLFICQKMLPGATERLISKEYDHAAARFGGERMPLDNAAYVACLLDALTVQPPAGAQYTFA